MFDIYDQATGRLFQHKYDPVPDQNHFFQHIHNTCELYLFISGNACFNLEGTVFRLTPFDLILIPPQNYHSLILEGCASYERFVFNFPLEKYQYDLTALFERAGVYNIAEKPQLLSVFERMKSYRDALPAEDFPSMAELLLQECLLILKNSGEWESTAHAANPLTKKLVTYINEHLFEQLTVEQIADHFYLSKSHIQNVFYGNMRIGIKSYILRKKMAYAKAMLQNGKRPTDVSAELGFNNYASFYKTFRHIYGKSPKALTKHET